MHGREHLEPPQGSRDADGHEVMRARVGDASTQVPVDEAPDTWRYKTCSQQWVISLLIAAPSADKHGGVQSHVEEGGSKGDHKVRCVAKTVEPVRL